MDTSKILRPEELPFHCPEHLVIAINELIDALERDDKLNLDAYLDEVEGSARGVSEENDAWIRDYYVDFGWKYSDPLISMFDALGGDFLCDAVTLPADVRRDLIPKLWNELGDVCIDNDGCIDTVWRGYEIGTHREEIWHDFEFYNQDIGISVAGLMGLLKTDEKQNQLLTKRDEIRARRNEDCNERDNHRNPGHETGRHER